MNDTNQDNQKQKIRMAKLPLVSLALGLFSMVLFLLSENDNRLTSWMVSHEVFFAIFWISCGLIIPAIGIVCGLYYLITVKTYSFLERACAILGTSLLELWFCMLWYKGGFDIMAEIFKEFYDF